MNFQNCIYFVVIMFLSHVTGQKYNLTRSSEYASLGEAFTWTCGMFVPPDQTVFGVYFYREKNRTALVGKQGSSCIIQSADPRYSYHCLTKNIFLLTIPAENMTEFEQKSTWRCEYVFNASYRSDDVILNIAIEVYNVSLTPSDNPLTIREGILKEFNCVVNSNAVPSPTITWYLVSTDITTRMETNTTSITITGNRKDNGKTLECTASNNNKPPMTANTTLNVEYPPTVAVLSQQDIIEGRALSVTCNVTLGNPSLMTVYWTKVGNQGFRQNESTLLISNIQRASDGTYRCTAENNYSNGEKGTHNQSVVVNVLYPPNVTALSRQDIIEGRDLSVTCNVTPGKPSLTTVYWTKVDTKEFRQNGHTLQISNIQRASDGTYRCTAENNYSNGEKGTHNQSMVVNVLYPPIVTALSRQDIIEGKDLSVTCNVTPGNPSFTTVYWTKEGNQGFRQNVPTLHISNIQRASDGTYKCTAENNYSNGENGTHNQSVVVNVLYQPTIEILKKRYVNESEKITLIGNVTSNPLADVLWLNGTDVLKKQTSVSTALFTIENALCTDTKNYTVEASNGIGITQKELVELFVNCRPIPDITNITLGVTDTTGIDFSTTVIAFPEPQYVLEDKNGTRNTQMTNTLYRNAVNNFTVGFNQTVVNQSDYGTYNLKISNLFGEAIVQVNVLPQRRPDIPRGIAVFCEVTNARIQWISSFNGGDSQNFTVFACDDQHEACQTAHLQDSGEKKLHEYVVQNLQPSRTYAFYISALNKHGNTSSEKKSCITSKRDSSFQAIAGGAAAGGIILAVIVIVCVVLLRRYMKQDKQAGSSQRLHQDDENENTNDDGMKENILYISAGPKVDEKPEAAVYAAVNKKAPESNNNANMYAEVNKGGHPIAEGALYSDVKPKRGLFKKESRKKDGNPKQKKGKKQKSKQDVADVYENSEDIAMSSKSDNVYSNTGQKVQNKEERGYKNKDGLLYVEVQFDAKIEKGNQTIHGEDEKTDYATVEFPMAAPIHDDSVNEKK